MLPRPLLESDRGRTHSSGAATVNAAQRSVVGRAASDRAALAEAKEQLDQLPEACGPARVLDLPLVRGENVVLASKRASCGIRLEWPWRVQKSSNPGGSGADRHNHDKSATTKASTSMTDTRQMLEASPQHAPLDLVDVAAAIDAALNCVQTCIACADSDLIEEDVRAMRVCIALCQTSADICDVTARVLSALANGTTW